LNLNKLTQFDHLTNDGKLNKIYTIIMAVLFIIVFIFTIGLWPDIDNFAFVMGVFGTLVLMFIEILIIIGLIESCWRQNWGKRYLKIRKDYVKIYERKDDS